MPRTRYNEDDQSVARSRQLRRDSTPAERKLWPVLRGASLDGFKFRRQQRLGIYFGDFVCQSVRLVIEIDGSTHEGATAQARDERRTAFLEYEGYRVVRFTNAEVMKNLDGVVVAIRSALVSSDSPSPAPAAQAHPLPQGEREA